MINHFVTWSYKEDVNKDIAFLTIKNSLEPLKDKIPGILELKVIKPLDTSTCEIVLISIFETEESLQNYQVHPLHIEVLDIVKKYLCNRNCLDF